jgi:DNA-binding NarL/FixJ family response regulator
MTRVFLATSMLEERNAIRRLLKDLKMNVVGEAADWETTMKHAPVARTDMLVVDWNLIPENQNLAIKNLRNACPAALVIVLISHLETRQQAALSASADAFISKSEMPARIAEQLLSVAASIPVK